MARRATATSARPWALDAAVLAVAAVLTAGAPFIYDFGALEAFRGPQRELAHAAWAVLAAALLVRSTRESWRDPWWLAWAGILAGSSIAALASRQPARSLLAVLPLALAALGWGALRQLGERDRGRLRLLVLGAATVQAVLALAFISPALRPEGYARLGLAAGRYTCIGTLGNPGYVGIFLALPAVMAAALALTERPLRRRLAWAAVALLLVATILVSQTMTALAAVLLGLSVLGWTSLPRAFRWRAALAAVAIAVGVAVFTPIAGRIKDTVALIERHGWIGIGSARAPGAAAALAMLREDPATGRGPGLFAADSFAVQSEAALAGLARIFKLEAGFGEAHNDLLQYAAETGALGLLLAGAGLAFAVRRGRREAPAVPGFVPVLATAAVIALLWFPLHLPVVAAQWVVISVLALPPLPVATAAARRTAPGLAVVIAAAAAAGTIAWERHAASRAFAAAEAAIKAVRGGANPTVRLQVARTVLERLSGRERWLPYAWPPLIVLGNVAVEAGQPERALRTFGAALALAERPEIRFDVGMALLLAGEREAGLSNLLRAVQLNPMILREVQDAELARVLRRHLDASGYSERHPWIYRATKATR